MRLSSSWSSVALVFALGSACDPQPREASIQADSIFRTPFCQGEGVPGGYGGSWLEGDTLHVMLRDLTARNEAGIALQTTHRGRMGSTPEGRPRQVKPEEIVFHQGVYELCDLELLKHRVLVGINQEGLNHVSIPVKRNLVVFGVDHDSIAVRMRREAAMLGVPMKAVLFERQPRASPE